MGLAHQFSECMKAYWVVNDPATLSVLLNVIPLLIVASTDADVPPKASENADPAVAAVPAETK